MSTKMAERAPSLADRLAEARAAEALPRERVIELTTPFEAAVAAGRHQAAAELQPRLDAARQDLLIAEATTGGAAAAALRDAQALEIEVGQARRRGWQGRILSGQVRQMPGRTASPNQASILAEGDPLVRMISLWHR